MSTALSKWRRSNSHKDRDSDDEIVLSSMDRALERRRLTPARIAAGATIAVLGAFGAYTYVEYGLTRSLTIGVESVTISEVGHGTFREYIAVTGNVVPRRTVYLDAIEGGKVMAVHAEAGAVVAAGQPLVRLKNTSLELEVIGREAQLTEQLNDLTSTRLAFEQNRLAQRRELLAIDYRIGELTRRLERQRPLLKTGGAAASEVVDLEAELEHQQALREALEQAQVLNARFRDTQLESLREATEAMSRNLELARENLENLVLTAPISGQLTLLDAHVGESKAPGERIGRIDEQHAFKVAAFVDEFYLARVAVGQNARVETDDDEYALEVVKVFPDVQDGQFQIELDFIGPAPRVRRGQSLRMQLEIGQPTETLVLANGAFFAATGGSWVFALDVSGRVAERRSVQLGRRNPEYIEVLEGLERGDRVITSSYEQLREFDRIVLDYSAM